MKTKKTLHIAMIFEPSRLASDYLTAAYGRMVPLARVILFQSKRPLPVNQEGTEGNSRGEVG